MGGKGHTPPTTIYPPIFALHFLPSVLHTLPCPPLFLNPGSAPVECIFIEVKTQSKKKNRRTLVGVVYRPPNRNINGDFNFNLLNYDHRTETRDYVDTMFSNVFLPLITKPTRITPTSATLIDNIYSNDIPGENTQMQGIIYIQTFLITYQYFC